ncbi:MAG: hypothetical protein A2096_16275 [Spirochaetes bacterium GWF1_41_5]|nr:MAG: hypothetical protein A2096_16275 [Spirochaetes bacterium GWF1_41_5]
MKLFRLFSVLLIFSLFYTFFLESPCQRSYRLICSSVHSMQKTDEGGPFNPAPDLFMIEFPVYENDSLWFIAQKTGRRIDTLVSVNELKDVHTLQINSRIKVPNRDGILHTIKKEDSVASLSEQYSVSPESITSFNKISENDFKPGLKIFIPDAVFSTLERAKKLGVEFLKPVQYSRISSLFGFRIHPISKKKDFHAGLDLSAPYGSTVYSSRPGRVIFTGIKFGYGKVVFIEHSAGYTTRYAHLSRIAVRDGQQVKAGHPIGEVGSSGFSTGNHLHFEIRRYGEALNPRGITDLH